MAKDEASGEVELPNAEHSPDRRPVEVIRVDNAQNVTGTTVKNADTQVVQMIVTVYPAGSLPSAPALREYEELVPGIAKQWTDTFFSETTHRRERDRASDRAADRAQHYALAIMVLGLLVIALAVYTRQIVTGSIGFVGLAAVGYVFFKSPTGQDSDSSDSNT